MRNINTYISEKLRINKNSKDIYNYFPKNNVELRKLIKKLIDERGKDANLNDIDVSNIKILSPFRYSEYSEYLGLFENLDPHNIDISEWNVSNATCLGSMFYRCENFNCNLGSWNVSNVEYINTMFYKCSSFKGEGLENWNVKKVKGMNDTFKNCKEDIIPSWYKK